MNSNIASEFLRNIEFCIWLCPWASSIHSNKKRTHIVAPPLEQESFNNSLDQEQSNCRNCSREHAILKSYISERTPTKCTTVDKEWTHNWFICQLNTIWKCSQKHNRDKSYEKEWFSSTHNNTGVTGMHTAAHQYVKLQPNQYSIQVFPVLERVTFWLYLLNIYNHVSTHIEL